MPKFEIGDKIKVVGPCILGGQTEAIGKEFIIGTHEGLYDDEDSYSFEGQSFRFKESWIVAALTNEEKAQELLEQAGYTVLPPKPKLTGSFDIVRSSRNGVVAAYKSEGREVRHKSWELIAIVPWTEGDGL